MLIRLFPGNTWLVFAPLNRAIGVMGGYRKSGSEPGGTEMGSGFGSLGWQEKEKGQVQPWGPGLGPQRVPLGPLFCTPYPHPATQTLGTCTSLPPLVSPVLCQDTSPAHLQPSQPSLPSRARFFPCLDPTVAVLCPFLSQSHRGVGVHLAGTSQSCWSLGIIQEMSFLSTAHSLPEGSCLQGLHLLPTAP